MYGWYDRSGVYRLTSTREGGEGGRDSSSPSRRSNTRRTRGARRPPPPPPSCDTDFRFKRTHIYLARQYKS